MKQVKWQLTEVASPLIEYPVSVIAAKDIPYIANANSFQNLNIYLPKTTDTLKLVGTPATSLPGAVGDFALPQYYVHIHGGAWRDPQLTSGSIEPTVAHAFRAIDDSVPIKAIASLNYTVSQFPTHPQFPYDAIKNNHCDIAREAVHPQHVSDVLHGLELLRSFGMGDASYILSGHSCGACIAFQTILNSPPSHGLDYLSDAPGPAVLLGLNGLYDLPNLVDGLDTTHQHLREDYDMMLTNAFGANKDTRISASPSRIDPSIIAHRVLSEKAPRLILLDHSIADQLVPMNQQEMLKSNLKKVKELRVIEGHRCAGKHATPWEQGLMIWQNLQDIFQILEGNRTN